MNKEEFLAAIAGRLRDLPREDIEESLAYYREMIDDRMEEGMSEAEAVAALGTADEAAAQILADMPLPKLVKARLKPRRTLRIWEIVLLLLGSPLWLPLVLVFVVVVFVLYLMLWLLVAVLYTIPLSCALSGLASVVSFSALAMQGHLAQGAFTLGVGLVLAGLSIPLLLICNRAARGVIVLSRLFLRWLKAQFIRKEEVQ